MRCGDISDEGLTAGDGTDGVEIDTDDEGLLGTVFLSDLHPPSGGGTEIDDDAGFGEEVVLSVQMYQFAVKQRMSYMLSKKAGMSAYKEDRAR